MVRGRVMKELVSRKVKEPEYSFILDVPAGSSFEKKLKEKGSHEPLVVGELKKLLRGDTIFYDVGSRWGYYSISAYYMGVEPENIYSFENNEEATDVLVENMLNNEIYDAHLTKETIGIGDKSLSIDEFVKGERNADPPDVMKIDIEGDEMDCIIGMEGVIGDHSPVMMIEVHPKKLLEKGQSFRQLVTFLQYYGYDLFSSDKTRFNEDAYLVPIKLINMNKPRVRIVKAQPEME